MQDFLQRTIVVSATLHLGSTVGSLGTSDEGLPAGAGTNALSGQPSDINSKITYQSLETEIQELLSEGAIAIAHPHMEQCTSRLFAIQKKGGSLWPIINLKPLNQFMERLHLKMTGLCRVRELLRRNDWMCSVDLKDAYLSVPIAKHHGKFLARCDIQVQMSTIWPFQCPKNLHKAAPASDGLSEISRHENSHLFG